MAEKNPWLSIWTEPRLTIRQVVAKSPKRGLWFLAAIYGFSALLNSFQSSALGQKMGIFVLLLFAVILSPFWGYIVFGVWSWVVLWTGKLFRGKGDFQSVRAAYAWSSVPLLVNDALWLVMIALFGSILFTNLPGSQLPGPFSSILFLLLIGKLVFGIWSLVIYINALAEVQKYSILRSIGNIVVTGLLFAIAFGFLFSLLMDLLGISAGGSHAAFQIWNGGEWVQGYFEANRGILGGV